MWIAQRRLRRPVLVFKIDDGTEDKNLKRLHRGEGLRRHHALNPRRRRWGSRAAARRVFFNISSGAGRLQLSERENGFKVAVVS